MKLFARPLFVSLLFMAIVLSYYGLDYLNYSRAGKLILTGAPTLGLLVLLLHRYPARKWVYTLYVFVTMVLLANLAFQAGLRDIFGVEQDEMMIMKAIFSTDDQESYEFLLQYKPYLLKHFILFFVIFVSYSAITLIGIKQHPLQIGKKNLAVWILLFVVGHLDKSIRYADPFIFFPHFYSGYQQEIKELKALGSLLQKNINHHMLSDVKYTGKKAKNTVVWVIGESSTRHNWSLYGYHRNTTPQLDRIKGTLLVFTHTKSAGPITIPAFERMMTSATIKKPELWKQTPSILQIAKQAGYHIYWISNHTTDAHNGITYLLAHQADETVMTNLGKARGEGSFDASVIPSYKKALASDYDKKLIIVHLLGSHPAYNFRYPKAYAKFTGLFDDPVSKALSDKGRAKWAISFRNFYDNSVLYGDHIRYTLLKLLQESKESEHAAWLYHPDHGEDVCHHSNFSGHNKNAKEQWEIPMVFWPKPNTPIDTGKPYQLDEVEHTLLGLLKIQTRYYDPNKDVFIQH